MVVDGLLSGHRCVTCPKAHQTSAKVLNENGSQKNSDPNASLPKKGGSDSSATAIVFGMGLGAVSQQITASSCACRRACGRFARWCCPGRCPQLGAITNPVHACTDERERCRAVQGGLQAGRPSEAGARDPGVADSSRECAAGVPNRDCRLQVRDCDVGDGAHDRDPDQCHHPQYHWSRPVQPVQQLHETVDTRGS